MSELLRTDFTQVLKKAKNHLDVYLRIPLKDDAEAIITKMKKCNTEINKSALGDLDKKLLKILSNDSNYISKNHKVLSGNELVAKSLFEVEAEKEEKETGKAPKAKSRSALFEDVERNAKIISSYEKDYVNKLKSIDELDKEFLERLNTVHILYKSSSDYMERTVKRLLADFNKKNKDGDGFQYDLTESARVLILKHFIRQFGYDRIKEISCPELETAVKERYNEKYELIDESIFDLIENIEAAGEEADDGGNNGVVYTDKYISIITKLQDTIRIKAPLIYVTEDICKRLCKIISSNALSTEATEGKAVLLSECFSKPYFKIQLEDFVNYRNITDIESLDELNNLLKSRYQNGYLLYTDFSLSERLYTIMKDFSSEVLIKKGGNAEKTLGLIYKDAKRNEKILISNSGKVKLSDIFDPEKIVYTEIEEADYKLALTIEKNLLSSSFEDASANDIKQIRKELKRKYTLTVGRESEIIKGEKARHEISYNDYSLLYRMIVIISEFAESIPLTKKNSELLLKALPEIQFKRSADAKDLLSDYINSSVVTAVKELTEKEVDKELNKARKSFVSFAEKHITDKSLYTEKLRERIESRYNNSSKAGNDNRSGGTAFSANKKALYEYQGKKLYDYKLLQIADDLSKAKFSSHGKTREYLYLFAIAFGMTSSGYDEDVRIMDEKTKKRALKEDPRKLTDIQKNLFFDYYADNIVNNIKAVSGFGEGGKAAAVDGYGINYKNFAEVTFLWCIDRKDMNAEEKLKMAYDIIDYCKKNGMTEEKFVKAKGEIDDDKLTQVYKERYSYIEEEINDAERFKEYLINNYACNTTGSVMKLGENGRRAGIELEKQQERVKELFKAIEREMFDSWNTSDIPKLIIERDSDAAEMFITAHYLRETKCRTCERRNGGMYPFCYSYFDNQFLTDKQGNMQILFSCKDYFPDMKIDEETLRKSIASAVYIGEDPLGDFERRITTLSSLCSKKQAGLKRVLEETEKRIKLDVLHLEKKNVSRSAILALCYFEVVFQNYLYRSFCESAKKVIEIRSFDEFYKQFCEGRSVVIDGDEEGKDVEFVYPGADTILKNSGYQEINSKNIFDIYIIFMAYKDNYKKLYEMPDAVDLLEDASKILANLELMKKEIEANRKTEYEIPEDWPI